MIAFPPDRRRGLAIHLGLTIFLGILGLTALYLVFNVPVGPLFMLAALVFILSGIFAPLLGYRAYALYRSNYLLDRNMLRLVWGLRVEEIPVSDVEWIRPVEGLLAPLTLPIFRLPGGILGVTSQPDIGKVEFLASEPAKLLLVATSGMIYAISPDNPSEFMMAFQKNIEMGSLHLPHGQSQYPTFMLSLAWDEPIVKVLWLLGAFVNVAMLVWVSLVIPGTARVGLGFDAAGVPLEAVPGVQLILLPILSTLLFVFGLGAGLAFFRKPELSMLSLSLWVSGTLSSLFFLVSVYFILSTPVPG